MDAGQLAKIIKQGIDTAHVEVTGDGRHFQALVVSETFIGMSMIQQHQAVYRTLGNHFDTESVHALQLLTYTLQQWHELKPSVS